MWHSIWHCILTFSLTWALPLRSGARSWGPAVPTEIWSSQAVLTAIWSSLLGGRKARKDGMRKYRVRVVTCAAVVFLCRGCRLVPQTVCRWEVHDIHVILTGWISCLWHWFFQHFAGARMFLKHVLFEIETPRKSRVEEATYRKVYFFQGGNESPTMRMTCRTPCLLEVKLMVRHAVYNALCQV